MFYSFVIGTAILTEKKFKNIHRYICALFDLLCQVFADNLSVKVLAKFFFNDFTGTFSTL